MTTAYAIVTGAGSGIGRATATLLAGDDLLVVAADRDLAGADATVDSIQRHGGHAETVVVDVAEGEAVASQFAALIDRLGPPAVVVNNAGIGVAATLPETDVDDWDRTVAVNLSGVFHVCRAVLPPMIDAGAGVIVNVSSVSGVVGVTRRAAYCASKAGIIGLTRAIAVDHAGQGIRANAICPGTVATEWIDKILANAEDPVSTRRAMEERQPDGRMGSPEEVAAGITFLAAPEARFVNGAAFVMDGGMTAL